MYQNTLTQSTLKKLYMEFCDNRGLLNWLRYGVVSETSFRNLNGEQPHRSFPRLVALTIYDILLGDGGTLSGLLAALGEPLEHLEVGCLPRKTDNWSLNEGTVTISIQGLSNNLFLWAQRTPSTSLLTWIWTPLQSAKSCFPLLRWADSPLIHQC